LMCHEYKAPAHAAYHPHAAALLTWHAISGRLPLRIAGRSIASLLIRVMSRRYSASHVRQFAYSSRQLLISPRAGLV
jgi:hypothetical protein